MTSRTERVDAFQRRHPVLGFPLGVAYKFLDDQGFNVAVVITHNAFVAVFPLLLISSSVLGFVLQGNDGLRDSILDSAVNEFPIIGSQLGTQEGLRGSTGAVFVGAVIAVYGALGLGQALQNAVNVAWSVPRNKRRNPFQSRLWSAVVLAGGGLLVLGLAALTNLTMVIPQWGPISGWAVSWLIFAVSAALTTAALTLLLRRSIPQRAPWRHSLPGAAFIALGWLVLQELGGYYVGRVLARASDLNAVFALSLGLLAFLLLAANMVVIGVEINVVLARRLYPRAMLTPFTDRVELTDADQRAYTLYAQTQRHKGFESISVTFDPPDEETATT